MPPPLPPTTDPTTRTDPALALVDVGWRRDDRWILRQVTWTVRAGERWIVLGRNGSGKSTLVRIASLSLHPSTGTVDVLGERLGRTDVRTLRRRIGLASAGLADQLRPTLTARDVVQTARYAALEPWWHTYTDEDATRAGALLDRFGVGAYADRPFGSLSSGERQRVLLARTLFTDPGIVLLDEPTAGLDLPGREDLVGALAALAADLLAPPVVLVTHHLEEIPPGFTHVLLLRDGEVLVQGPIADTLDSATASACFDMDLAVTRDPTADRWTATAS